MNHFEVVIPALIGNSPWFLAWLVGIVVAVRIIERASGKAEYLLLIVCSLMFTSHALSPFLSGLALWLVHECWISRASASGLALSLSLSILGMAGVVYLVYAFWTRWKTKVTQ